MRGAGGDASEDAGAGTAFGRDAAVAGASAPNQGHGPVAAGLRRLRIEPLGRMAYREALVLQAERHQAVADGLLDDTLLLVEHPAVITLGRASKDGNVLSSTAALEACGIEVVQTGRGGDVTYHGPGQLVAYPIVALQPGERDLKRWVWTLEELVRQTVAQFGVTAERVDGLRGLWVGNDKVAAIGIRMMRWVSCHGLALNVQTRLEDFAHIVPCGLSGRGVTSLHALVTPPPSLAQVQEALCNCAGEVLQRTCYAAQGPLPVLPPERLKAAYALLM